MPMLKTRIQVPAVIFAPTVLAVHLAAPWVQPLNRFRGDLARFPATLREVSRDAGEQGGAGLTRTYPSKPWRKPMIGIDHVLVYNCTATSAGTVDVPGSDHRGLATTVEIPVDPTASYPPD